MTFTRPGMSAAGTGVLRKPRVPVWCHKIAEASGHHLEIGYLLRTMAASRRHGDSFWNSHVVRDEVAGDQLAQQGGVGCCHAGKEISL